jgi:hypothetical protein
MVRNVTLLFNGKWMHLYLVGGNTYFLVQYSLQSTKPVLCMGKQVKTVHVPTEQSLTTELCAPLVATLPLEV